MLNELIQLEQNELQLQLKLKTNRALITGLDQVKDGIIITSSNNEIEFYPNYLNDEVRKIVLSIVKIVDEALANRNSNNYHVNFSNTLFQ